MRAPRVKPVHEVVRAADGRIRLGGRAYGVAAELPDPTGVIWSLLQAMDGTRTVEQVAEAARRTHPDLGLDALRQAVADLERTGFVEEGDLDGTRPRGVAERHSRSASFYRYVDRVPRDSPTHAHDRLRDATAVLVGVGGSGCTAAYALVATGVGRVVLVDDDTVALSNLGRQVLFTGADLDRPKVEVAAERLRAVDPSVDLDLRPRRVTGPDDLAALMAGADVLLLCADHPRELASWANEAALATGTAWVHGGYDGPHVSVTLFVPGEGACLACHPPTDEEEWEPLPGLGTDHPPVTAATAGVTGSLMAHAALAHLTGVQRPEPGRAHVWSMARLEHTYVSEVAEPGCPACRR